MTRPAPPASPFGSAQGGPGPSTQKLRIKTPPFSHHGIAFSPFFEDRIAVASGANFGLVGNGRVHVMTFGRGAGLSVIKTFDTQDCVYDVAWNEMHENQVMAACGNGSLRLFDLSLEGLPTKVWHEHSAEVVAIDWNNIQKDMFVSASWDQTVKVWTLPRQTTLLTLPAHTSQIFSATFSPHSPSLLATSAADGLIQIFDIRSATSSRPVQTLQAANGGEVLSVDWNKYDSTRLVSGGKDGIRIWDMRSGRAVVEGRGHGLTVRKVQWSPHKADLLASTSYDMTCRTWTTNPNSPHLTPHSIHSDHSEFCMGVAWALFDPGLIASVGWDQEVHLFRV